MRCWALGLTVGAGRTILFNVLQYHTLGTFLRGIKDFPQRPERNAIARIPLVQEMETHLPRSLKRTTVTEKKIHDLTSGIARSRHTDNAVPLFLAFLNYMLVSFSGRFLHELAKMTKSLLPTCLSNPAEKKHSS
jgi:hypothetical protein